MAIPKPLQRGLRLPVIASPMFIVSNPDLVISQCKAGVIGAFPSLNARPQAQFGAWLDRIATELAEHDARNPDRPAANFAVNLIVHRSNDRLAEDIETCVAHRVPLVITSLGAQAEVNQAVHSYGGLVFHDVINQRFAHKAIEKGADGLILVAAGAGGHAGLQSPFALVQETRAWFDGPIALSGAIASGRSVLAAEVMGADFGYIGSAFIATEEANAPDAYKRMIVEGSAEDIVYSNFFSGVHGNYMRPSIVAAGYDPDDLPVSDPSKMDLNEGSTEGKKAWRDIWGAGQGIGAVDSVLPAAERIDRLVRDYESVRAALLR